MESKKINPQKSESLRISNTKMKLTIKVFDGMDGEFRILFSPSLNISGYGKDMKEAEESFVASIEAFAHDLKDLSPKTRDIILANLGWHKEKFKQKNYAHAFIDKEGVLQNLGLDLEEINESEMMLTI